MEWTAEEKEMIEKTKQALAETAPTASGRSAILRAAEKMVTGHRQEDYGEPEDNFSVIAKLWSAYCGHEFTAHDVAMMLGLVKVGRISNAYKKGKCYKDGYVDGAGYFSCAAEIAERGCDKVDLTVAQKKRYTFGNDEFSLESAYHDCKLVFDGITDDESFQEADTGLILYYANEIIYALQETLEGTDKNISSNDIISRQAAIKAICEDGTWLERQGCTEITMVERKQRDADILGELPSAQPERCEDCVNLSKTQLLIPQPKSGEWEEKEIFCVTDDDPIISQWQSARCSECGKYHTTPYMYYFDNYNFCPNCGVDMRGEKDDK